MMASTDLQSWGESAVPARWWAFYVRVTREESVTADLSIPNQIARAKEIAATRGWHDYKLYVEPRHVSAELWIDKRPALNELLDDVAAGHISGVCARHTDRLWRNNDIQARLLHALRLQGVELWDFTNKYDYKSAHGRFSLQVLGAASELEVNLTAERIREMKRGKAAKGKTGGGPPPFGYTSQSRRIHELEEAGHPRDEAYRRACLEFPIGKCWYIDEREAEMVRLIFELYTSPRYRYGCKRIVRHLNERGYKTRQVLFPAVFRDVLITLVRGAGRCPSQTRPWAGRGRGGGGGRDGGSKGEVVVGEEGRADGGAIAPEQVAQLVEVSDEDGDERAVGRCSFAVEDAIEVLDVRMVSEEHLLGGDQGSVEDRECSEVGRGAEERRRGDRGGDHVTSVRAAATWSAVTVLALAMAAAMRP
jgi:DNA invertase Pin-like site-specific DNA recombinase